MCRPPIGPGCGRSPYAFMTSADEEVEDVHAGAGLRAIQLGVSALAAGDGDELLVLHVEQFGEIAAGRLELVAVV